MSSPKRGNLKFNNQSVYSIDVFAENREIHEEDKSPTRKTRMREGSPTRTQSQGNDPLQGNIPPSSPWKGSLLNFNKAQDNIRLIENMLTEILKDGFIQTYIDLLYLIQVKDEHQALKGSDYLMSSDLTSKLIENKPVIQKNLNVDEINYLRDQLVIAEISMRRGDIPEVLGAYDALTNYYMSQNDIKNMIYFCEKCLEVARAEKDQVYQLTMLNKIGSGFHALRQLDKAQEYLEKYVALASNVYQNGDDKDQRTVAFEQLGRVYADIAQELEDKRELLQAIEEYKKYLDCSILADDTYRAGLAQYKIGSCYNSLVQPNEALPFLNACLITFQKTENRNDEGKAYAELAKSYDLQLNKSLSIEYLKKYMSIAVSDDNLVHQADAYYRLGEMYTSLQEFTLAKEMHEKHYELLPALSSDTRDTVAQDYARINVGMARMNENLDRFLNLVNNNFQGLLQWKTARTLPHQK